MANSLFCIILGVLVIFLGHVHSPLWQAYAVNTETWCVAKPSASSETLESAESYACESVDCSFLHTGNPCFTSNLFTRASFAMNAYYKEYHVCDFAGFGIKSITNPSYTNCDFFAPSEEMLRAPPVVKWCIAKPTAPRSLLQMNFNLACSQVNCSAFETSGDCHSVNTTMNRASFAMNHLYQAFGGTDSSCFFNSTGMIVIEDPSHGTCIYGSKRQEGHGSAHISAPATPTRPASVKTKPRKPASVKTKPRKSSHSSVMMRKAMVSAGIMSPFLILGGAGVRWWKRSQTPSQPQTHPQQLSISCAVNIC